MPRQLSGFECGLMRGNDQPRRTIYRVSLFAGEATHPIRIVYYADIVARYRGRRGCVDRNPVGHERF